jgi:hypothetical protein
LSNRIKDSLDTGNKVDFAMYRIDTKKIWELHTTSFAHETNLEFIGKGVFILQIHINSEAFITTKLIN